MLSLDLIVKGILAAVGFVGGITAAHFFYTAQIQGLKTAHAEEVANALIDTAKAEDRERRKERDASEAAKVKDEEHQKRQRALEASNVLLAADGLRMRNRYALLAAQNARSSKDPIPAGNSAGEASACWSILGRTDELAERRTKDSELLAEQVRQTQGYIDSLKPFMVAQ